MRKLTIAVPLQDYKPVAAAIMEVPALHALKAQLPPAENLLFWKAIAQFPHHMSRLQSLEGVPSLIQDVREPRVVPHLADLTHLTCLEMVPTGWTLELFFQAPRWVDHLSLLSALQVLRIDGDTMGIERLRATILPMVGLRELSLSEWDPDMQGLDSLLTAMPALTKLSLGSQLGRYGRPRPPFPVCFRANGIVRLCNLSINMDYDSGEDVLRMCQALTGLQRLQLVYFGDQWRRILDGFPAMPFLTELRLEAGPRGVDPVGQTGSFLADLPQLKRLTLHRILDVAHCQQAQCIKHIAGLTQLTYLELDSGDKLRMAYNPVMFTQLHRLTALKRLAHFVALGDWTQSLTPDLEEVLVDARSEMGVPPIKFGPIPICCYRRAFQIKHFESFLGLHFCLEDVVLNDVCGVVKRLTCVPIRRPFVSGWSP
eukprot:jgi/Botrbrau1/1749/Bobra.0217s0007.1